MAEQRCKEEQPHMTASLSSSGLEPGRGTFDREEARDGLETTISIARQAQLRTQRLRHTKQSVCQHSSSERINHGLRRRLPNVGREKRDTPRTKKPENKNKQK